VPLAANLASGELAINTADGKLFYKDTGGVVQVLASKAGNVNVSSFSAGTTGFTPNTATTGAVTLAGTLATTNGGTGLTSFTANGVVYASSTSALATGSALTFDGTSVFASPRVRLNNANRLDWGSGSEYVVGDNGGAILFGVASSEQMRLTSTGLGIGTSSPAYKLSVSNGTQTGLMSPRASASGTGLSIGTDLGSAGHVVNIVGDLSGGGTSGGVNVSYYSSTSGTWNAGLSLRNTAGSYSNLLLMQEGGNVGIGTSSPGERLDVVGTARVLKNTGATNTGDQNVVVVGATTTGAYASSYGAVLQFQITNSSGGYSGSRIVSRLNADNNTANLVFQARNYGFSDSMTLDASGNLGVGTSSPSTKLHVAGTITAATTGQFFVSNGASTSNQYFNVLNTGGSFFLGVESSGGGSLATGSTGYASLLTTQGATPLQFGTNLTVRATLDSSGNLGLGVTPSAWGSSYTALQLKTYGSIYDLNAGYCGQASNAFNNGTNWIYRTSNFATRYEQYVGSTNAHSWYIAPSGTAGDPITFTQAMTLDASGNLLVGTTGLPVANGKVSAYSTSTSVLPARFFNGSGDSYPSLSLDKSSATNSTSQIFAIFTINNQSTGSGQINANGASQVAFGTFSDSRLKENIVDLPSQLNSIMALRPVEFDYIKSEGGGHQIGFVAQEMQTVYPDAIGKRNDEMFTVTGWSKTEARLVKAIQEQQSLIESLTTRLAALEAK
jgi:hypothetical protein